MPILQYKELIPKLIAIRAAIATTEAGIVTLTAVPGGAAAGPALKILLTQLDLLVASLNDLVIKLSSYE